MDLQEILQENVFTGGSNQDVSVEDLPNNIYFEGNDVCINPQSTSQKNTVTVNDGNVQRFGLGQISQVQDQQFKITIDSSRPAVLHIIQIVDANGNSHTFSSVQSNDPDPAVRRDALVSLISGEIHTFLGNTITNADIHFDYYLLTIDGGVSDYTIIETIEETNYPIDSTIISTVTISAPITRERLTAQNIGAFEGATHLTIGDDLFLLSTNGTVGQVSVAVQDGITGIWTHTSLLRSKNLPILLFDANKAFAPVVTQLRGELTNDTIRLKWVDGVSVPRAFYVKKQIGWVTDESLLIISISGGVAIVANPDGFYTYNDIEVQTRLQIFNNTAYIKDVVSVNDTGGTFTSGNKRFAIRGKAGLTLSGFGILSDCLPIPIRSLGSAYGGGGYEPNTVNSDSATGVQTTKSVRLLIDNLNPFIFSEFEVAVIEYVGTSVSAFVVGPFAFTSESFEITIAGNENKRTLSLSTLQEFQPVLKTVHLNEIQKNILFLGRVEIEEMPDLANFTRNILFAPSNIEIKVKELQPQGNFQTPNPNGEYNNPLNCYRYTGFTYNETYRVSAEYYFDNGLKTQVYFGRDITITENTFLGDLTRNNVTTREVEAVYAYYINLKTIDLTQLPTVNGIKLSTIITGVRIVRTICKPQVLATGYALLASVYYQRYDPLWTPPGALFDIPAPIIKENPVKAGTTYSFPNVIDDIGYLVPSGDERRYVGNFISEDISVGLVNIIHQSGDVFTDFGEPDYRYNDRLIAQPGSGTDTLIRVCLLQEFNGHWINDYLSYPGIRNRQIKSANSILCGLSASVEDSAYSTIKVISAQLSTQRQVLANSAIRWTELAQPKYPLDTMTVAATGMAFSVEITCFDKTQKTLETGAHYTQYFRPNINPYGDPKNSKYLSFGPFIKASLGNLINTNVAIFSGDTFTQKSFQKTLYNVQPYTADVKPTPNFVYCGAVSFYSQNRSNAQLRNANNASTHTYPLNTSSYDAWQINGLDIPEIFHFDLGYMPTDNIRENIAINPDIKQITVQETSVYYSDENLETDISDQQRIIRVGNVKSYETTDGPLTGINKLGNNLVIHQRNNVQLQPINPNVVLSSQDISGLILGIGAIIANQTTPISRRGTSLKSAVLRAVCKNGEKIFWYDTDHKSFYSVGIDGFTPISDIHGYSSFLLANNLYIKAEKDIILGYDPFYDEVYIVANVFDVGSQNYNTGAYNAGDRVYTMHNNQFEKIGYIARVNVPANKNPDIIENQFYYWDYDRQSNYTLIWNESKKCFNGFYIFRPQMIIPYKNTMLTTIGRLDPTEFFAYEHHTIPDPIYYDGRIVGNPYLIHILNTQKLIFKQLKNLFYDTDIPPSRIEIINDRQNTRTFIGSADILTNRNLWKATSKFDATITLNNPTGSNQADGTKRMTSQVLKIKSFLQVGSFLKRVLLRTLSHYTK